MTGIGDLTNFVNENGIPEKKASKPIWNPDWLAVDPFAYSETERLPDNKKRLDSKTQLSELWDHSDKIKTLQYVKDQQKSLETQVTSKEASFDVVSSIERIALDVRKRLTLGSSTEELADYLHKRYTIPELQAASPTINVLIEKEYGLLGNVYVDPAAFKVASLTPPESCERGAKELKGKAVTARYLRAMDSCASCIFNQNGNCAKFSRAIVSNLNYDSVLIKTLAKDLVARGKISSTEADQILQSKDPVLGLRKAFTAKKVVTIKEGGFFYGSLQKLTKEELAAQIEQFKKDAANKVKLTEALGFQAKAQPIWNTAAKHLIDGESSKTLNLKVASKYGTETIGRYGKILDSLYNQEGLLGNLYITTEPWNWNCKQAKTEIKNQNAQAAPFIFETPKCASCVFNQTGNCSLFKKVITAGLNDFSVNNIYPLIIENLYQAKRLNKDEYHHYLNQSPKLEHLKQAFLSRKAAEIKLGGITGKVMQTWSLGKLAALKEKTPVSDFLKKEMHRGSSSAQIYASIKQKFTLPEIQKENIKIATEELGLLGNVYISPDIYQDCRVGAKEFNPSGKLAFVKAANKCFDCPLNRNGHCQVYKKPILGAVDWQTKMAANFDWQGIALNHYQYLLGNKKLSNVQIEKLKLIPDQKYALKLAYTTHLITEQRVGGVKVNEIEKVNVGRDKAATVTAVQNTMLYHMNNGKFGNELANILKNSFDQEALVWARPVIEKIAKEDVVLGQVYVNPLYNQGDCEKTASYVRKTAHIQAIQAGSKCVGCKFNQMNKYCSLIKRPLAASITYTKDLSNYYLNILQGNNRLDEHFKVASTDYKQTIREAFKYTKKNSPKTAGLKYEEKKPIRQSPTDLNKIAQLISQELLAGVKVEILRKKYASLIPLFEVDKMIKNAVLKSSQKVAFIQQKKELPTENLVDDYGIQDSLDVNLDNRSDSLDMNDYLE